MDLNEALKSLDVNNDEQWTNDGLPSANFVKELTGNEKLTREQITKADPSLTRHALITNPKPVVNERVKAEENTKQELRSLDSRISELDRKMNDLDVEKQVLMATRIVKSGPSTNYDHKIDQQRKIDYIQMQHKIRVEKAERRKAFLGKAAGAIKPADFDPRSKVDQAMARKKGRGVNRPVRQPLS